MNEPVDTNKNEEQEDNDSLVAIDDQISKDKSRKAGKSLVEKNKYLNNQSRADEIIDTYPQNTFISNCVPDYLLRGGKHRILQWNLIGIVSLREEFQFTTVDVEFMDKNYHRNLVINDDFKSTMAAMNFNGLILANKAEEQDQDKYEEMDNASDNPENDIQRRLKNSNIYFKPFNEWKNLKDWNFELKDQESVDCVAIGSGWACAYTDFGYIRVFSLNGI